MNLVGLSSGGLGSNVKIITNLAPYNNDVGAAINAADAALGSGFGEILVLSGGGTFLTTMTLSPYGRRVYFGPGNYYNQTTYTASPGPWGPGNKRYATMLFSNNAIIEGADRRTTVFWERDTTGQTDPNIIAAGSDIIQSAVTQPQHVCLKNFKIMVNNAGDGTGGANINFLDGKDVEADRIWIYGTGAIGISIGGTTDHCVGARIHHCRLENVGQTVGTVAIAAVNARGFWFTDNEFLACSVAIDLESNRGALDYIDDFHIERNVIDTRGMPPGFFSYGVILQANALNRNGVISGNTITGEDWNETFGSSQLLIGLGIGDWPSTKDIVISNNVVKGARWTAIGAGGERMSVVENTITNCLGSPLGRWIGVSGTYNRVEKNLLQQFKSDLSGTTDPASAYYPGIQEAANAHFAATDFNVIRDNWLGANGVITTIGANTISTPNLFM